MFRRQDWLSFGLLVTVAGSPFAGGCATRTVYVVQDPQVQQAPQASPTGLSAGPMAAPGATQYNDGGEVVISSPNQFYQPLAGYGSWVSYPGYGQVFVPSQSIVGSNFRPYTNGHWEYTQFGWTWVDHHPFGWATGHYGNWMYDGRLGWAWVPGTQWAPAWVSWRQGGGYVGWAPMPPGSAFGGSYNTYDSSWVFVSTGNFGQSYVGGYLVTGPGYQQGFQSTRVINQTTIINNQTTYMGPGYDDVRREGRVIHRPIEETERDYATTRPPRGTVIERSDTARNGSGAPSRDDNTGRGAQGRGTPADVSDARGAADPSRGAADPSRGAADPSRGAADPSRGAADPSRGAADPSRGAADPSRGAADPNPTTPVPGRGAVTPAPTPPLLTPIMPTVSSQGAVTPAQPGATPTRGGPVLTPVMPTTPGQPTTPNRGAPVLTPVMPVTPVAPVQPAVPGVGSKDRDGTPLTGRPEYPALPVKPRAEPPEAFERARAAQPVSSARPVGQPVQPVQPVQPQPVQPQPRPSKAGQVVPFNDGRSQPVIAPVAAQPEAAAPARSEAKKGKSSSKGSKGKGSKGKTPK
jgi:hypothetical protein